MEEIKVNSYFKGLRHKVVKEFFEGCKSLKSCPHCSNAKLSLKKEGLGKFLQSVNKETSTGTVKV